MSAALKPVTLTLHHTPRRTALAPTAIGAGSVRRILRKMLDRGYRFVGLDGTRPYGPPPGSACLTVDDGYASTALVLAPLLRELGIPWTVFVLAGPIGRENAWDLPLVGPRERHLTAGEIRRLAEEGVTIGSHGMEHRDLTRLGDRALTEELAQSRLKLMAAAGCEVSAIAYPRGRLDARVAEAARRAGYRCGFGAATPPSVPESLRPMALPRAALYAPDQIPGLFAWTALDGPAALARCRAALADLGGALILGALAARGRPRA